MEAANTSLRRLARAIRRRVRLRVAVIAAVAVGAAGVVPAAASAYWDYQGYLSYGAMYGEAQPSNWGTWWIRLSRSNCSARMELRHRATGYWQSVSFPGGCSQTDYSKDYWTEYFSASHAINIGDQLSVWVNVRIASAV
jgi:hypothetical protein